MMRLTRAVGALDGDSNCGPNVRVFNDGLLNWSNGGRFRVGAC